MSNLVAVDTNILVYWVNVQSVFHEKAREFFDSGVVKNITRVVTWQNLIEFYAVVTDKKRFPNPLKSKQAIGWINEFLDSGVLQLVVPNERTRVNFFKIIKLAKPMGQKVHDVFLAATLMSNGVDEIATENLKDFSDIEGLKAYDLGSLDIYGK